MLVVGFKGDGVTFYKYSTVSEDNNDRNGISYKI